MAFIESIRSFNRSRFLKRKLTRLHMGVMLAAFMSAGVMSARAQVVEFPLHANDLKPGERIVTKIHGTGGGPQTGAKDFGIVRWVDNDDWQKLKVDTTAKTKDILESINFNYLIWERPVYAMTSGTVIGCWRNAPDNTGHIKHTQLGKKKILLEGNHLWIQQTDGNIALYAHAKSGDIPENLCPNNNVFLTNERQGSGPIWWQPEAVVKNGATVTAGQLLFHAGNSGNSSEPHLHVHIVNSMNTWQPMKFARGQTTPFDNDTASLNGPWTRLKGNALPMARILVWPPHPIGNWTHNGIEGPAYQRMFDHFVDSGVMADTVTCKDNGSSYNTTWIPAKGLWISHHGMSASDFVVRNTLYTQQGYKVTSAYTCGSAMVAVWRKP